MKNSKPLLFLLALGAFALSSCDRAVDQRSYIFIGHPYQWIAIGDRVDPRIAALPLSSYDQIWLGGDVCAKTTDRKETLARLDSLFRFGRGNVHWAWGNHDVEQGNEEWISATTGRPDYYTEWVDGMALVVLNTNLFQWPNADPPAGFCARMEGQYDMLLALADTVRQASHVVILHHYGLLTDELADDRFGLDTVFNYYKPFLKLRCEPDSSTFEAAVYPLLAAIRKKGIEVVLIGGDIGQRAKSFEFQTKEGIWFLGSGINNSADPAFAPAYVTNFSPDKVLVLRRGLKKRTLEWEFQDLDSLIFQ